MVSLIQSIVNQELITSTDIKYKTDGQMNKNTKWNADEKHILNKIVFFI